MSNATTAMNKTEWILLALSLALLAALGLRPSIRGIDGVGNYVYLASLLRGGDLDFTDEYRLYDARPEYPFKFSQFPRSPVTGRPADRYGIGAACFWSPFVVTTHFALKLAAPARADALGRPYEWAVGLGTAFWGSLGLALLYGRLRRRCPPPWAGAVLAGLILATPLGFYLYAHGSMSHGVDFFIATALMLAFERAWSRPTPASAAGCGFWSAWLIACRTQDATWVLVLAGLLLLRLLALVRGRGGPRLPLRHAAQFAALFLAAFLAVFWLQMAVWKYLYGSWLSGPMPYLDASAGAVFSRWPIHLAEVLFSGRKGVLAWHPLIAIGLAGLVLLWRRPAPAAPSPLRPEAVAADRMLGLAGLLGFALQLWLVACWSQWWAGASFGNRFFISALPFVALGLGRLTESLTGRRRQVLALGLLGLLTIWNMGLLLQYATEMIPREDWVSWSRIIRQNLTDVPAYLLHHLGRR